MPWTKTKSFALETLAGVSIEHICCAFFKLKHFSLHGQSKAYYDTMLALAEFGESAREALEQFGPNKTAVWYKDVLKTFDKKHRKNVLEKKQLDSQRLEDAEDEESILKTLQTDFSKASAASAKKNVRSAARPKVQTPELRLQGVQGIESSSEDDAGGVKDTGLQQKKSVRAQAPPGADGHGARSSRLVEAVATTQEHHEQAEKQKQAKRTEKKSRAVTVTDTDQPQKVEHIDMDLDSAGTKRRREWRG